MIEPSSNLVAIYQLETLVETNIDLHKLMFARLFVEVALDSWVFTAEGFLERLEDIVVHVLLAGGDVCIAEEFSNWELLVQFEP